MDPLAWLGLKKSTARPHLTAIVERARELLPQSEPVVLRYIVIVAVLLTRVAQSDGKVLKCELDHLGALFRNIDRMPPEAIDGLCHTLNEHVPLLTDADIELCYRELKSLCDADERLQVMRLLASQATSDGSVAPSEHHALTEIAEALGIAPDRLEELEVEALSSDAPAVAEPAKPT